MADETQVRALRDLRQEQPHLLDYVRVLLRRKYLVIFVFSMVILGAVAYLRATIPIYEARARLIIEARTPDAAGPIGEPSDQSKTQQDYQTHYQLLQSRNLARTTIDTLGLWDHPALNPALVPPDDSLYARVRTQARTVLRMITRRPEAGEVPEPSPTDSAQGPQTAEPTEPSLAADTDELRLQDRIINSFLSNLEVMPVQNSRLLDVSFRSSDAALAATVVNGLASTYIAADVDTRSVETRKTSSYLTEQIEQQRKRVAAAEDALQRYRERTGDVTVESGNNIVVQKLADLNAALTKAKTERMEREAIYRQVAGVVNQPEALASIPAVLANPFVQQQRAELVTLLRTEAQLADRLGDRHPEMIKVRLAIKTTEEKLKTAIQDVVQSLKRDYDSALAQENSLTAALNQQKDEAQSMNRKAIDLAVLQRDVENAKLSYDTLVQQGRQAAVSEDRSTISNVRVVDRAAVPDQPISPKRRQILLMALLGAFFVSVSAAFFVEYLDSRVKTPEQVEIHLRLASLGSIPRLPRRTQRAFAKNRFSQSAVPSSFAEAFHGLRANVLFSSPDAGPCSIVVTSASPREGKTIIAANLAIGLAQAGHRVTLVDADLRQPRLHEVLGLSLEPGLSNLLHGDADAAAAVRPTQIPNLSAVTAGAHPPNPAELVGSYRFGELLSLFEKQSDIVVIDTPPVMAVADAAILAHRTSGVLFVVAADTTSRHAAQSALEQLERANGRFLGAVLNRVDHESDTYRYASYSRGYRAKTKARTVLH
jgi:capsular exopolysaccharide synthesis family protein